MRIPNVIDAKASINEQLVAIATLEAKKLRLVSSQEEVKKKEIDRNFILIKGDK